MQHFGSAHRAFLPPYGKGKRCFELLAISAAEADYVSSRCLSGKSNILLNDERSWGDLRMSSTDPYGEAARSKIERDIEFYEESENAGTASDRASSPPSWQSNSYDSERSRSQRGRTLLEKLFGDPLYGQSALQYLIGLKATFLSLDRPADPKREVIWRELDRILAKYSDGAKISDDQAAWDDANRCERLLVNLYDATRLDVELDRRILEAQQMKMDFASFYAGRQMKATADNILTPEQQDANRSLLSRLVQDQQWHDAKLYLKRGYARTAQMRVSIAFLIALMLFGGMMWSVFGTSQHFAHRPAQATSAGAEATQPEG